MSSPAASLADDLAAPFARVRNHAELFTILFLPFFSDPPKRHVDRVLYRKASAFVRGLAALVRRALLMRAAAILPTLPPPPARTPAARPRAAKPATPVDPERPPTFNAFRQPALKKRRKPALRPIARQPAAALADLRPLSRRFDAIMHALDHPGAIARRLAFRLRRIGAPDAAPQIVDTPRLHPDHECYLARDLDIYREDANAALRAAFARRTPIPADRTSSQTRTARKAHAFRAAGAGRLSGRKRRGRSRFRRRHPQPPPFRGKPWIGV